MDGAVQIVTGRERRWRWSSSEKLRIVAEAAQPGAVIRAVAGRHDVCESLLSTWRRRPIALSRKNDDGRTVRLPIPDPTEGRLPIGFQAI